MKILVYGINYSPELTGIGKYTGEMVEWLAAQGHEVRVITAPPYYPLWQVGENYSAWRYKREEGAATVWRCPLYVPKQPSTLKRLLHLGSFAASSFFPLMAQRRWKPDRIIGVVPTLFCTPGMRLLTKALWRAYRAAYSGLRSGRHAGAGPCRKRQRRQSGTAGNGVRT